MKRLYRLLRLPYLDKKLLGQSLLLIIIIRIGLSLFSYARVNLWLNHLSSPELETGATDWQMVKRVSRSVRSCSRFVPYASCLTQALAAGVLLSRRGQRSELKIGVEKDHDEKFGAHAWIEVDGRIVIGKESFHSRFVVLNSSSVVL